MKTRALMIAMVVIGCGGKTDDTKPAEAKPTEGSAQPAVTAPAKGSSAAAPVAPPMSSKIKAARCGEPCLFLVDTPLAKLTDTYKTECGGMVTKDLGFDDCKHLDFTRNCIYAAHGLVFKQKKWKTFEKKPWYDANPAFQAASISEVERSNVHELDQRGKACKKGMHISGADFERVKAWFAALPKAEFPAVIMEGDEINGELRKMTKKELLELLRNDFARGDTTAKLRLPANAVASYEAEVPAGALKALGAAKDAKLRSILIDVDSGTVGDEENPISEGTYIRFIYDESDKLRALVGYHYLWD